MEIAWSFIISDAWRIISLVASVTVFCRSSADFWLGQAEQDDHLLLPRRHGQRRGRLQVLDQRLVARLDDADLRQLLDAELARLLQVEDALLQPVERLHGCPDRSAPPACRRRHRRPRPAAAFSLGSSSARKFSTNFLPACT